MPRRLRRQLPIVASLLFLVAIAAPVFGAGPPFPDPVSNQSVYDPAGAIRSDTAAVLERQIDAIRQRSGAEIVIYLQVKPDISEEQNLADARALMDQWGVGRKGFDDGLVILLGLDETRLHGRISLYAGSGFTSSYIDENGLKAIIDDQMVPLARAGDIDGALLSAMDVINARVTPEQRDRLARLRQLNAVLGLVAAPVAFLLLLGLAFRSWRRSGDDPPYLDSPSILMAGPPAGMTPALATVVTSGRATQHSLDTTLVELASRGRIGFWNLDRVHGSHSDDPPDPQQDPAILLGTEPAGREALAPPQQLAEQIIRGLAGDADRLSRASLWPLNDALSPVRDLLEREALRLGWFTHLPGPAITRWTSIGSVELLLGAVLGLIGLSIPMSGLTTLGVAAAFAGIGTIGFGRALSQRTPNGAMVDAMLKAYRRTLAKTLEQARSMTEVVADRTVRILADTPDKAVVWGFALGLHDEISAVLERSLVDQRESGAASAGAYYPYWLGSSSAGSPASLADGGAGASVFDGSGSVFSGSGVPDLGGMFSALGSLGSNPSSSSSDSGGGGFGGGGGGGGGGASGSF